MLTLLTIACTAGLQSAAAYESEVQDIEIAQESALLDETLFETGYLPSGSPLAIGFTIEASQTAWVDMLAEAELTWPEALSLAWHGIEGTGWLALFTEMNLITAIQYDVAGYTGEYEIDSRSFTSEAQTSFDPLLLPYSTQTSVSLSYDEELDAWSTSYSPISVIEIGISVTASLSSNTTLEGVRVDNEGADSLESDGAIALLETPDDSAIDVSSAWVGLWDTDLNVVLTPAPEICVDLVLYTTCETVAEFDYDIELSSAQFEESFDPVDYVFPLPWMSVSSSAYDFGEQLVETTGNLALEVSNSGLLLVSGTATIDGDEAFEVWPDNVYAPSESVDGLVVSFTPSAAGPYSAIVTLETNDPRQPTTEILLSGTGVENEPEPGADDTGDTKLDTIGGEVTCGCAAGPSALGLAPILLFAVCLPLRRREKKYA